MASTAISAQGSTLQIGTGSGAAKTISGAAIGFPTILTSTAHGLGNGDVVAIAAIVGTLSALNGSSFVVSNVTANTFAIAYDSTGLAYTSGGTATPTTWTAISNIKDFSGFDGAAAVIDVTNLASVAKEKRLGLVDNGQFSFNMDQDNADAGQLAVRASRTAGTSKSYKLTLPNTNTATFTAFAQKVSDAGAVDGIVKNAVTLILTGAVTRA